MARIETWYEQDLQKPVRVHNFKGSLFSGDASANRVGVVVTNNGAAATLSGSATGYFMLANGTTATAAATITGGNKVYVNVPATAYSVPGPITVTIKLTDGSVVITLLACVGIVVLSRTDIQPVSPGAITDWTNQISSALQEVTTIADNVGQSIAVDYDSLSQPIEVGTYAMHNGLLYCCKTRITDDATFVASHWRQCNVMGELTQDVFDLSSAFNDSPVDAHETNFAELTSVELNPLTTLKEIDKNYKQYNGKFINASNKFAENNAYTTFIFRLPFYGFKITCAATKIYICNKVPEGTVGETIDIYDTITTSGSQSTFVEYTMNYSKGAIVVLVWNTQGIDPTKVRILTKSNIPFTEPRLKMLPFQDEFNFYAKKDTSVNTGDANRALGIITYTGKVLSITSGNVSDHSSYNTYSFQVPVDSLTITCLNGFRCTKSYYKPGDLNSDSNLIELVYATDSGRVETFTAKYKEWVSISVNMNSYPGGLNLKTNLSHPFELPGLMLSVGQSQSFYRFEQLTYASGSQRKLYVYFRSGNKIVQWLLWNTRPNTGVVDTWQIGTVIGFDFNGTELSNEVELVKNGEFEIAFKEHGAADYCGGANHGDEITNTFKLFLDGKLISDLSMLDENYHVFNRIDAFEIATINRCDTAGTESPVPLITHQKRWVFENGKVTVNETIKTLVDLSVDGMLCCMFPALRSAYTYGIRQGRIEIEDLTTSTYEKIVTTENEISYLMYGANCTARINSKLCDHTPTGQMWINPTSVLNKLYYGFWGATDTAHPVSVPANTVVWWENEYDVAYN